MCPTGLIERAALLVTLIGQEALHRPASRARDGQNPSSRNRAAARAESPSLPKVLLVLQPRLESGRWPSCFHQGQALKYKHFASQRKRSSNQGILNRAGLRWMARSRTAEHIRPRTGEAQGDRSAEGPHMNRDSPTWDEFESALAQYRDKFFSGKPAEERYYLDILTELQGKTFAGKAEAVTDILLFLNRWKCRFSRVKAPVAIRRWIITHAEDLERLRNLHIADPRLLAPLGDIQHLYESSSTSRGQRYTTWGMRVRRKSSTSWSPGSSSCGIATSRAKENTTESTCKPCICSLGGSSRRLQGQVGGTWRTISKRGSAIQ